jgi:hypothetical protein
MIDHDQDGVLSYLTEGLAIRAAVDKVIRAADVLAELENLRMRIGGHPARANNFALNIAHRCKP